MFINIFKILHKCLSYTAVIEHLITTCDNVTLQCLYDVRDGARIRLDRPCTEEAKQIK